MAKLKILKNGKPDVDGYVSVVQNLVENKKKFNQYQNAPNRRPTKLQKAADANGGSHPITQLYYDQAGTLQEEQITNDNCIVMGDHDALRDSRVDDTPPSKVTVAMPVDFIDTSTSATPLDYLDDYITAFLKIYLDPNKPYTLNPKTSEQERARQFMFGMMLLTRCR